MANRNYIPLLLLFLYSFTSCVVDGKDEPEPPKEEQTANEWIVEKMRDVYLWNDEIPADNRLSFSQESDRFFTSLLSNKDGKNGKNGGYFYSYISKKDGTTKAYMGDGYSYGFEFIYYSISYKDQNLIQYALQVVYVLPDSPAAKAGITRGNWIVSIDGTQVPGNGTELYNLLDTSSPRAVSFGVAENPANPTPEVCVMTAAKVKDDPVFAYRVIPYKGKNVGYLAYNHFTSGPLNNNQDETYNNSLRKAFGEFASANVDEFVLDLRYNGGGLVSCAHLLATMLAPASALSAKEVFCHLINNKDQISLTYTFDANAMKPHGANIDLKKLYVITSNRTASASEAVINGLKPHMEVILVGEQTEGKNVGSVTYTDPEDKFEWELHPIVSRLSNSKGFSDYANGFAPDPDFECTEGGQMTMYDLGDENEFILKEILDYIADGDPIDTGKSSTKSASLRSSGIQLEPISHSLDRKKLNSVILPPGCLEN